MGYSKKGQVDSGQESEGKKWVIAGIAMRATLKPVNTKARGKDKDSSSVVDDEEEHSTTPTSREARIPERLPCPPAPRKRRPAKPSSSVSRCLYNREFFIPPDLDTVFKCYAEKAN